MVKNSTIRLGVNIDHVATIRNARGGQYPDPIRAAHFAAQGGADGITAHLREDRRHIRDHDIARLKTDIELPLNLEMAATNDMVDIAVRHKPHAVCLVPEKREERTTEGGLDVVSGFKTLVPYVARLINAGCRVSLFVEPQPRQIDAAAALGAPVVELHTGAYCNASADDRGRHLQHLRSAAVHATDLGLECHAGHGLTFDTVGPVVVLSGITELNIGHFLVGEAVFIGLKQAVSRMRAVIDAAYNDDRAV